MKRKYLRPKNQRKIVIIGIDGLDYRLTKQYLRGGLLPNLGRLKKNGFYSRLATTTPPQSPVAWATFITGSPPARHGIFDFIVRDPQSYLLSPVFSPAGKSLALKAAPFWRKTAGRSLTTKVLFLPVTYPPERLNGELVSGMGTPDILGTEGAFTLWTTDERLLKSQRGTRIRVDGSTRKITSYIPGPKVDTLAGKKTAKIPLTLTAGSGNSQSLQLEVQKQQLRLAEGRFSDWIKLSFRSGTSRAIRGIAKFFLKSVRPHLSLYLSPINIDPTCPLFPISYPANFARRLVRKHGLFATLGLPHDTWALQEGIFSGEAFLRQADDLLNEKEQIILDQLARFDTGLFIAYIGSLDSIQHMFFRDLTETDGAHSEVIPEYYQKMDVFLNKIQNLIGDEAVLIVISDHGFARFDWEVNLNAWLRQEKLLSLITGKEGEMLYENVDWSKTKAFAAGFNSVYLNLRGREAKGVVPPEEQDQLVAAIKTRLTDLKHPRTGEAVVKNVYSRKDMGIPPGMDAPDLIVGYTRGFRASWKTAVGAAPVEVFSKRTKKWSGDHLFDASEVPGVIFSNVRLKLKNPCLGDILPYVLSDPLHQ